MSQRRTVALLIALAVIVALAAAYRSWKMPEHVIDRALSSHGINGSVAVEGVQYHVNGSRVTSETGTVSPEVRVTALKTMYALALAQRDPLLALPGVDLDSMASSAKRLAAIESALAPLQSASSSSFVSNLYPTSFLTWLASAESARRAFIESGSNEDAMRYHTALHTAVMHGESDIVHFKNAFNGAVGPTDFRIGSAGGTISDTSMRSGVDAILSRLKEIDTRLNERDECIEGRSVVCAADLALPAAPSAHPATLEATGQFADHVLSLYERAFPPLSGEDQKIVLSTSTCVSALSGPYFFSQLAPAHQMVLPFRFIGDILVSSTTGSTQPYMRYIRSVYGVTYNPYNPFTHYLCPEVGGDLSRILTTQKIRDFARAHPGVAPQLRTPLLQSTVTEWDADAYFAAALEDARAPRSTISVDVHAELEELALEAHDQTLGFDTVLSGIANVLQRDIDGYHRGVAIQFVKDARFLFSNESPFPSLYLAYSPAFGSQAVSIRDTEGEEQTQYFQTVMPLSRNQSSIPGATLVHDLREHTRFETIGL